MLIVNPDGLFRGDRLAMCSKTAWLYWMPIFLCANGFGRFEVHHSRIALQIGAHGPTEAEFDACIREYAKVRLLFLYKVGAKKWGQWDADKRFLPRWKTAQDRQSPDPPEPDHTNWLKEYHGDVSKALPKILEDFGGLPENSECSSRSSCSCVVEVDVKTLYSSGDERTADNLELISVRPKPTDEVKAWFDQEFWPAYPRKTAKPQALKAARRHAKTAADRTTIMECLLRRLPDLQAQLQASGDYRPYPASWFNQTPWMDPEETARPAGKAVGGNAVTSGIEAAMRRLNEKREEP
jgi:hypothetical protein